MSKFDKLIERIFNNPKDASFDELDKILSKLGYEKKIIAMAHILYIAKVGVKV